MSPCKIAKRTLRQLQNAIGSSFLLHQETDGAPRAAAAPAPRTEPLGSTLQGNAETEQIGQRGADALHPMSPA
jgi:hypothetical protein